MKLWHRHQIEETYTLGRTFRHDQCRCGLWRITWLERGLCRDQTTWTTSEDADRQLSRFASEAPERINR